MELHSENATEVLSHSGSEEPTSNMRQQLEEKFTEWTVKFYFFLLVFFPLKRP